MAYTSHYSVLRDECINFLTENNQRSELLFADLTFGGGGHSLALAKCGHKVIATDQDPEAISNGGEIIKSAGFQDKIRLIHGNFVDFPDNHLLAEIKFDGILMDLGVSSHHFDEAKRGFSFRSDAVLDMRMDTSNDSIPLASEIINNWHVDELEEIFIKYGEERYAKRIAERIVENRRENRIERTGELENIIFHCYPKKYRYGRTNPATRCFQALRIAVNDELGVLERSIPRLLPLLKKGGRLAIISFHSLEDRIVKHTFKKLAGEEYKILTKKPIIPSDKEILENNRSRSAKLRVMESV